MMARPMLRLPGSTPRHTAPKPVPLPCPSGQPHYWDVEAPNGSGFCRGVCRWCGEERMYPTWLEMSGYGSPIMPPLQKWHWPDDEESDKER